jgi:hypothetical protein
MHPNLALSRSAEDLSSRSPETARPIQQLLRLGGQNPSGQSIQWGSTLPQMFKCCRALDEHPLEAGAAALCHA